LVLNLLYWTCEVRLDWRDEPGVEPVTVLFERHALQHSRPERVEAQTEDQLQTGKHCSGSGSFFDSRIRTLPSKSKEMKKNLDFYSFATS
jgi:hypothetical protein